MKEQVLLLYDIINPFFGWPRLLLSYFLNIVYNNEEMKIEEETYSDNDSEESISDIEYEEEKNLNADGYFEFDDNSSKEN